MDRVLTGSDESKSIEDRNRADLRELEAQVRGLEAELAQAEADWRDTGTRAAQTGYEVVFGVAIVAMMLITIIAFLKTVMLGILALLFSMIVVIGILMLSDLLLTMLSLGHATELAEKKNRMLKLQVQRQACAEALELVRKELNG